MDCPDSAMGPDIYPESLEFDACDISNPPCNVTNLCLVCQSAVESPQQGNCSKLLRHSGVPMLARLQQLLPLSVEEDVQPLCHTCTNLLVSIDELELQLSEQHCQLQRRHVQKAGQQDWQRAAEQVICSSVDEVENPCSSLQEIENPCPLQEQPSISASNADLMECEVGEHADIIPEGPGNNERVDKHAESTSAIPSTSQACEEGNTLQPGGSSGVEVHQQGQHNAYQDGSICEGQDERSKPLEERLGHSKEALVVAVADFMNGSVGTGMLLSGVSSGLSQTGYLLP